MPDSQQHVPVRLTQAQRKVVAEIAPELAERLKLGERKQRTIPFTLADRRFFLDRGSSIWSAEAVMGTAMSDPAGIQPVPGAQLRTPGLLGRICQLSPWRFVFLMSMVLVVAKLLQLPLWLLVFRYYQPSGTASTEVAWWEEFGWAGIVFVGVLLAPWLETLLGQTLCMLVTSPRSRPTMVYVVPATIWFCYLHGAATGPGWWPDWGRLDWWLKVLPHAASGFILACTFQHGWKHSWWRGIWMTSMVHCVGNLSALIILLLLPSDL